jgi:hypothetical protein
LGSSSEGTNNFSSTGGRKHPVADSTSRVRGESGACAWFHGRGVLLLVRSDSVAQTQRGDLHRSCKYQQAGPGIRRTTDPGPVRDPERRRPLRSRPLRRRRAERQLHLVTHRKESVIHVHADHRDEHFGNNSGRPDGVIRPAARRMPPQNSLKPAAIAKGMPGRNPVPVGGVWRLAGPRVQPS